MRFFGRYFKRRKLAPVVGVAPAILRRSYGGKDTYTAAQVSRVVERMAFKGERAGYVYAACCNEQEFLASVTAHSSADYKRLRAELAALFRIDRQDFTCRHLLALKKIPMSNRWAVIRDGEQGTHGGGVPHNESMM